MRLSDRRLKGDAAIQKRVAVTVLDIIFWFGAWRCFKMKIEPEYKANRVFFHGNGRHVLLLPLALFGKLLHQVAFALAGQLGFRFVHAEEFGNIVLVHNVFEKGHYRS